MIKHCSDSTKINFAKRLRLLRTNEGLLQKDIAEIVDVHTRVYQNYENIKSPNMPSFTTMINLARYYSVSIDYLLGETDNPNKNI